MTDIERERRFSLTDEGYRRLLADFPWSAPRVVTDIMLGPHGAASMTIDGWVLRLRTVDGNSQAQFKKRVAVHEYLEIGIGVDSLPLAIELFQAMGLLPGLVIKRARRNVTIDSVRLALDDIFLLGKFIEVEFCEPDGWMLPESLARYVRSDAERTAYGDLILDKAKTDMTWGRAYEEQITGVINGLGLDLTPDFFKSL
jgi:adenylate cyclase class IV